MIDEFFSPKSRQHNTADRKKRMDKEKLNRALENLKTQRDELRVQLHLANAELKDEWEELEEHWKEVERKLDAIRENTSDAAREAGEVLYIIGDELGNAYGRIRSRIHER